MKSIDNCISYEKLNFVMREESAIRARDTDLFFDTHYPIRLMDESSNQIDEHELHNKIIEAKGVKGSRIFLIKGNPGTGKSEFCWYFKLKAEASKIKRKIIHIPKSEVEPGKVARILLEACGAKEFDQKRYQGKWQILKETPETVAKQIFFQVVNEKFGSPSEKEFGIKLKEAETDILEYIVRWLKYQIKMAESSTRPLAELEIEGFDRVGIEKTLEEKGIKDFDIDRFELEFHKKINDFLNLPSIEDLLQSISEKFRQERPIIIIEDLVGIGAARTIILNALSDLARMDIDLVAGVIPAMEESVKKSLMRGMEEIEQASRELETETFVERSHDYSLTTETGESTFLNSRESVIDFIRPYLKHIRKIDCIKCDSYRLCKSLFDNLFPFNEEFIWRIFQMLGAKKTPRRDPRALIQEVRTILDESKNRELELWEVASSRLTKPFVFPKEIEEFQDFANFVSWYGKIDQAKQQILLSTELIKLFGIECPTNIPIKGDKLVISYIYIQTPIKTLTIPQRAKEDAEKISPRKLQEMEFTKKWLAGEKNVPLIALRHGLAYFLSKEIGKKPTLIIDKSIDRPKKAIEWTKRHQNEDIPIVFEDEEMPPFPHVYIKRMEIHDISFLLTDLGVADSVEERDKIVREIKEKHFHIIPLLQAKNEECREKFKQYLEKEMNIDNLDEWIICSYALCKMLLLGQPNTTDIQILDDKKIQQLDKPAWLFPEFLHYANDPMQIKQCYEVLCQLIENVDVVNKSKIFASLNRNKLLILSNTRIPDRSKFNFEISSTAPISFFGIISTIQRVSQDLKEKEQIKEPTERFRNIIKDAKDTAEFVQFTITEHNLQKVTEKLKFLCNYLLDPTTAYDLRGIISLFESLIENSDLEDFEWILKECKEIERLSKSTDIFDLNRVFNINYWLCKNRTYEAMQKLSKILDKNQPQGIYKTTDEKIRLPALENIKRILETVKRR